MGQLEIIHLRLAGDLPGDLCKEIRRSLAALGELESIQIYHHGTIDTDLAVHLRVRGKTQTGRPNALGIHLADSLREHGMVEHAVWVEDHPTMDGDPK